MLFSSFPRLPKFLPPWYGSRSSTTAAYLLLSISSHLSLQARYFFILRGASLIIELLITAKLCCYYCRRLPRICSLLLVFTACCRYQPRNWRARHDVTAVVYSQAFTRRHGTLRIRHWCSSLFAVVRHYILIGFDTLSFVKSPSGWYSGTYGFIYRRCHGAT